MHKFVIVFLGLLTVFSSCQKINNTTPSGGDIGELQASADFDWETVQNITISITSNQSKVIEVTSANQQTLYHKGFHKATGAGSTYEATIQLPAYIGEIRINGILYEVQNTHLHVDLSRKTIPSRKTTFISNPVALWKFDEANGNTAVDSYGDNDATISGASRIVGINQKALEFDGQNDNVNLQPNSALSLTGDQVSFSTWFKLSQVGSDGTLMFQRIKFLLKIDKHGKLDFSAYTPQWQNVVIDWEDRILDTDWHHLATTYDGNKMKIYVDGELMAQSSNTGNLQESTSRIHIGSQDEKNYFQGMIDHTAIYDGALNDDEVLSLYQQGQNPGTYDQQPISHWKLNTNGGSVIMDENGSNNGTIEGASWTDGMEGAGLYFDGQDDNVRIPNASNLNPQQEVTLMAWAKPQEHKESKVAQKGDWDGHNLGLGKWNGWKGSIRLATQESITLEWDDGRVQLGQWYHLAITYDGSLARFFVNGQQEASRQVSGSLNVNGRPFSIGSDNKAQKFFKGTIDDVRYFSSALSQTEIQAIFQNDENTEITDSDGDGIDNESDDFPSDPARSFINYYPAGEPGALAFEDLWPGKGDYDFNDLVLDYQFQIFTNASNFVSDVKAHFIIKAIGAGMQNGFGFQFTNDAITPYITEVSGAHLQENYINTLDNGLEAGQNLPTIIPFDNAHNIMPPPSGFGVNVDPNAPYLEPDTVTINISFTTDAVKLESLQLPQFNPFMIINGSRGREVHLPNYTNTALADETFFGTKNDDSRPQNSRYYKTEENLPWAIRLPQSFDYAVEKTKITDAHLKFYEWATSSGTNYKDWFKDKNGYRNASQIYTNN